jgi:acetyltransferase-like isoleucine patch superfamily enzyme
MARRALLKLRGVAVDRHCTIGPNCWVDLGPDGRISIGRHCELQHGVTLHAYGGRISIADNVFIGPQVVIYGHGSVDIGQDALIAMHCRILSSNHTIPAAGVTIRSCPDIRLPTRIGRDVWLGAGVTVLGGVTIGDGCIVGAGSLVASDIPTNTISFGVPATVRRVRTS